MFVYLFSYANTIFEAYTFIKINLVCLVFANSSFYSKSPGPTEPFLVLPGPKIILGIWIWCLRTQLIYTNNFLFLSVEDRQTDRQTDRWTYQASYKSDFSSLKNWKEYKFITETFFDVFEKYSKCLLHLGRAELDQD